MNLSIKRAELLNELAALQSVVGRKSTIPILSFVLLKLKKDVLTLMATDLEQSMVTRCDANQVKPGETAVPAKKLLEILRAIDTETVEMALENNVLSVSAERSRFKLHCLSASDYPGLPDLGKGSAVTLPMSTWHRLAAGIVPCIADGESRYQLNGGLIVFNEETVLATATDGHRLALLERTASDLDTLKGQQFLVPRRTVQLIQRFEGDEMELISGESHLCFSAGHRQLFARRMEGTFPDYERVIAKDHKLKPILPRQNLLVALHRVSLMNGERTRGIRLDFSQDLLVLTSANPDLGEAVEEVTCSYDGPMLRLGANPEYLIDAMELFKTAEIRLEAADSNSQMVLYPCGETDPCDRRALCVVMPMRV